MLKRWQILAAPHHEPLVWVMVSLWKFTVKEPLEWHMENLISLVHWIGVVAVNRGFSLCSTAGWMESWSNAWNSKHCWEEWESASQYTRLKSIEVIWWSYFSALRSSVAIFYIFVAFFLLVCLMRITHAHTNSETIHLLFSETLYFNIFIFCYKYVLLVTFYGFCKYLITKKILKSAFQQHNI